MGYSPPAYLEKKPNMIRVKMRTCSPLVSVRGTVCAPVPSSLHPSRGRCANSPISPTQLCATSTGVRELDTLLIALDGSGVILKNINHMQGSYNDAVLRELKKLTEGQNLLTEAVSVLTEASVRQSAGSPVVPDKYQAMLIGDLESLLIQIKYLCQSSSCQLTRLVVGRLTTAHVEDRILDGLTQPVGTSTRSIL